MKQSATTLDREKAYFRPLLYSLLIAALTGSVTYFISLHSVWQQWTILAHTASGLLLSVIVLPYTVVHFKRTLGTRRVLVVFSGWLALVLILTMIISGLHITIFGQLEALRWVYQLHLASAFSLIGLFVIHLLLHVRNPRPGGKREAGPFITFGKAEMRRSGWVVFIAVAIIATFSIGYQALEKPPSISAIAPYETPYGPHPFRPSQSETPEKTFISARHIAGSEGCADCHAAITDQWRSSLHAQAASDMSYVTNVSLLADNQGIAATRYCEGCHAPIALLTGQLSEGGKHGGIKNTISNREGVSCRSCHSINQAVHLKGVASYEFVPEKDYLFANHVDGIQRELHNFLIKLKPDQHKKDMARPILKDPKLCATCHVQFIDKDVNQWGWIKMQDEYTAWLNSPYSGQSDHLFTNSSIQRCHDCHMRKETMEDPSADANGQVVSHYTPGANTAIPWINNDLRQFEANKRFLQSGAIRLSIQETWRHSTTQSAQHLQESLRSGTNTPFYVYLGETLYLKIAVSNAGVGHDFPGGTIDINEAWLTLRVTDGSGRIIHESGAIDKQGHLDPRAYQYRSIPVDKQGKHVWRHDLFRMVGKSYRNVIKAGETDVVDLKTVIPYWAKGPITVSAVLRYRKFNQRYAQWALKENKKWPLPIIDMAHDALQINLRMRPPVEKAIH